MLNRNLAVTLSSAALIASASACGMSVPGPQPTSSAATAASSPAQPAPSRGGQACAELGGSVEGGQTCHLQSATRTYEFDISFPLDYPDLDAVTAFVKQDRDGFVDWVAQYGRPPLSDEPYTYRATAETYGSGTPTSGTRSLLLELEQNTGAAHQGHPDTSYRAFNYDLGKHVPITFDTVFKPDAKPLEVLNPIVHRELIGNANADWDPNVEEPDAHTYRNFALTDDAVTFFFGENDVVHDDSGPSHVSVPRSELAPLMP